MPATGATVTNSTAVDGTVIANVISSTGELHSHTLGATGQSFTSSFGSVPVPEPGSLAALAAACSAWSPRGKCAASRCRR